MTDTKDRLNAMLFNYETTYRTDFRGGEIKNLVFTSYQPKETCLIPRRPRTLKDIHTLTDWKEAGIPFSLLHKPKDIIRTNPFHIQEIREKYIDKDVAEAIRTRPRLVMTPGVSMDDIEDPRVRNLLLDSMYTSGTVKAQRELEKPYFSVRAPLPDMPAPANPVALPKLRPSLVHPEWRMESVGWDRGQVRTHCDPTREFWTRRDPAQCLKCDESATVDALRRAQRHLVKRN